MTPRAGGEQRRPEVLHVLKGAIVCGLLLTAGTSGVTPSLLGAALSLLAGCAFATGLRRADAAGRRPARRWLARIGLIWIASFTPLALLASPDGLRSFAAVAALAVVVRGVSAGGRLGLSGALLLLSVALIDAAPRAGIAGAIEHAFGATWPRGWSDVARLAGLFLLGGAWSSRGVGVARAAPPEWTRALAPLGSLGRAPFVSLYAPVLVGGLLLHVNGAGFGARVVAGAALVGGLLLLRERAAISFAAAQKWLASFRLRAAARPG